MAGHVEELTPREGAVLAAVGRRLGNAEIADELHVSVRTVESHIAALRRKLGVGTRPALVRRALDRATAPVALPDNSFVGRDRDLDGIRRLVDGHRVVTLTGPAGCGKTRLALEFARRQPRDVVLVELGSAYPVDVLTEVARALVLTPGGSDLLATCGVALAARPVLLLLDNCDRVVDETAALVPRLLASAPGVHVLATSRTPLLGAAAEVLHAVLPLGIEPDAVTLLLDRARSAAPGAKPPGREVARRICRRLDGVPLALELAAARLRHLSPDELDRMLGSGLSALGGSAAGRHRTLAAAFTWSWELLAEGERAVLARLAALPGAFDLTLAAVVAGPDARDVTLDLLEKSLVMHVAQEPPARFRLLGIVRELVAAGTAPAVEGEVRRAHLGHVARAAAVRAARARTDDSREAVAAAALLAPDAVDAIDWGLSHGEALAVELVRSMAVLVEQHGGTADLLAVLSRAARHPLVLVTADAATLCELGRALCYGDLELVRELAGHVDGQRGEARSDLAAHLLSGIADAYLGSPESAVTRLATAERLARQSRDPWLLGSVLQVRGIALADLQARGRVPFRTVLEAFASAMQAYAAAGDAMHVNNVRYMMASHACEAGLEVDRAIAWTDQCAAYAGAVGNRHELAHAVLTRARLTGTRSGMRSAVATFTAVGDLRCLTRCHLHLADHALRHGQDPVPDLELAYAVATRAHDDARRSDALALLVDAHWRRRRPEQAAVAVGMLAVVVGEEHAWATCPGLTSDLEPWLPAVARGRARVLTTAG